MKILIFIFAVIVAGILGSCSGVLEPDFSSYNTIAISVGMNSTRQIVIIDCNAPSNYQIITGPEESAWHPVFSPDKRYITYFDHSYGFTGGGRVVLYDTYTGKKRDWIQNIGQVNDTMKVCGTDILWELDSEEFYVYQYLNSHGHAHMKITKDEFSYLKGNPYPIETFVGFKNSKTLIVRTTTSLDDRGGFYYLNKEGEFLDKIDNPHLKTEYENNKSTRHVGDVQYYPSRELFVFSLVDSSIPGKAICVTNLDGSYFEVLTQGFSDANPSLNHFDNVIYFERREWTGSLWKDHPIMSVSLDTKQVTEFFKLNKIPGATDMTHPDF